MKSKIAIFIILLVIVVGALLSILLKGGSSKAPGESSSQSGFSTNNLTGNDSQATTPKVVDLNALLASFPTASSSPANRSAFDKSVSDLAIGATTLDVTGCNAQPKVMKVFLNKSFTLKNDDIAQHVLTHGDLNIGTVGAKSAQDVSPAFPSQGVYGYLCDGKTAGIFYVTQ